MTKNRYKFTFGDRTWTLTTDKDNLYMEEVEKLAREKYDAIRQKLPQADQETIAVLLAINVLSTQLGREKEMAKLVAELDSRRYTGREQNNQTSLFEDNQ